MIAGRGRRLICGEVCVDFTSRAGMVVGRLATTGKKTNLAQASQHSLVILNRRSRGGVAREGKKPLHHRKHAHRFVGGRRRGSLKVFRRTAR
jgi:hypothetical protein